MLSNLQGHLCVKLLIVYIAHKIKISPQDFSSKCEQICSYLEISFPLIKDLLMVNATLLSVFDMSLKFLFSNVKKTRMLQQEIWLLLNSIIIICHANALWEGKLLKNMSSAKVC